MPKEKEEVLEKPITALAVVEEIEEADFEEIDEENKTLPNDATLRDIQIDFTDKEKIDMGSEMTELIADINSLESQKKSANSSYASQIKVKQEQLTELSDEFKDGKKWLSKVCKMEKDYLSGDLIYKDYYSGHELMREKMEADDFQTTIDEEFSDN